VADHYETDLAFAVASDPANFGVAIGMVSGQKQVIVFLEAAFFIRLVMHLEVRQSPRNRMLCIFNMDGKVRTV
jgi:hypothetical protein